MSTSSTETLLVWEQGVVNSSFGEMPEKRVVDFHFLQSYETCTVSSKVSRTHWPPPPLKPGPEQKKYQESCLRASECGTIARKLMRITPPLALESPGCQSGLFHCFLKNYVIDSGVYYCLRVTISYSSNAQWHGWFYGKRKRRCRRAKPSTSNLQF